MSDDTKVKTKSATGLKSLPKVSSPGHVHKYDVPNEKFAKDNQEFHAACDKAGVKPTARQASKYRNKRGSAYVLGR